MDGLIADWLINSCNQVFNYVRLISFIIIISTNYGKYYYIKNATDEQKYVNTENRLDAKQHTFGGNRLTSTLSCAAFTVARSIFRFLRCAVRHAKRYAKRAWWNPCFNSWDILRVSGPIQDRQVFYAYPTQGC